MFRLTRRSLWEHKRRLVSTIVAIVLGVGFMAGTFVLTDTTDRGFDDLFADANEHVDAQVQGKVLFDGGFGGMGDQREPLDPSVLTKVAAVDSIVTPDRNILEKSPMKAERPPSVPPKASE